MTAHTHSTIVAGCFRCELHLDEVAGYIQSLVVTRRGVVHDPDCSYVSGVTSSARSWVHSGLSGDKACRACLPDGVPIVDRSAS